MTIAALVSAGTSLFSATKAPKKGGQSTTYDMTPEQKAMLAKVSGITTSELSGEPGQQRQNDVNAAIAQATIGSQAAMRSLDRSAGSGLTDDAQQRLLESGITAGANAAAKVRNEQYNQVFQNAMRIGLSGPRTGTTSNYPVDNSALFSGAGNDLGQLLPMLLGNKTPVQGETTPTTQAPSSPGAPAATQGALSLEELMKIFSPTKMRT
jgi:hypothetical protein